LRGWSVGNRIPFFFPFFVPAPLRVNPSSPSCLRDAWVLPTVSEFPPPLLFLLQCGHFPDAIKCPYLYREEVGIFSLSSVFNKSLPPPSLLVDFCAYGPIQNDCSILDSISFTSFQVVVFLSQFSEIYFFPLQKRRSVISGIKNFVTGFVPRC